MNEYSYKVHENRGGSRRPPIDESQHTEPELAGSNGVRSIHVLQGSGHQEGYMEKGFSSKKTEEGSIHDSAIRKRPKIISPQSLSVTHSHVKVEVGTTKQTTRDVQNARAQRLGEKKEAFIALQEQLKTKLIKKLEKYVNTDLTPESRVPFENLLLRSLRYLKSPKGSDEKDGFPGRVEKFMNFAESVRDNKVCAEAALRGLIVDFVSAVRGSGALEFDPQVEYAGALEGVRGGLEAAFLKADSKKTQVEDRLLNIFTDESRPLYSAWLDSIKKTTMEMLSNVETGYRKDETLGFESLDLDDLDDLDDLGDLGDLGDLESNQVEPDYQDYLFLRLVNVVLSKNLSCFLDVSYRNDSAIDDKDRRLIMDDFNKIAGDIESGVFEEKKWSESRIHHSIEYLTTGFKGFFEKNGFDDSFIHLSVLNILLYPEHIDSIIDNDDYESDVVRESVTESGKQLKASLPGLDKLKGTDALKKLKSEVCKNSLSVYYWLFFFPGVNLNRLDSSSVSNSSEVKTLKTSGKNFEKQQPIIQLLHEPKVRAQETKVAQAPSTAREGGFTYSNPKCIEFLKEIEEESCKNFKDLPGWTIGMRERVINEVVSYLKGHSDDHWKIYKILPYVGCTKNVLGKMINYLPELDSGSGECLRAMPTVGEAYQLRFGEYFDKKRIRSIITRFDKIPDMVNFMTEALLSSLEYKELHVMDEWLEPARPKS